MGSGSGTWRLLIGMYLLVLHGILFWLLADKFVLRDALAGDWSGGPITAPNESARPQAEPAAIPSITPSPGPVLSVSIDPQPLAEQSGGGLIVPVVGVRPDQLTDTYTDARSNGRTHDAIDIMAPGGTPVVAAADGEIVKFHDSEAGGNTIYQISTDKRYFFYYAHLQSRAPEIAEKQFVKQGTVIGYVGDTGNAGPGNTHLHFSINSVIDPAKWWEGVNINPYPILRGHASLP